MNSIKYTVYPPNCTIRPTQENGGLPLDAIMEIGKPDEKTGEGKINVSIVREMEPKTITWQLYKPDGTPVSGKTATTIVSAKYNPAEDLVPYFVRYYGGWTNRNVNQKPVPIGNYTGKNGTVLGENITKKTGYTNEYELRVGDGEEHYILFDKTYVNSYMKLQKISNIPSNLTKAGLEFEAVDLEHNGNIVPAIRISGGKDEIKYDRVKFDSRLYVDVESQYGGNVNPITRYEYIKLWDDECYLKVFAGTETIVTNLWEKRDYYVKNHENWYFYTDIEYNEITDYDIGNAFEFRSVSSFENPGIGSQYKYASKKDHFKTFIQFPDTQKIINGYGVNIPVYVTGYYYLKTTVNAYPDVFTGENLTDYDNIHFVSEKEYINREYINKYQDVYFYIYGVSGVQSNIGNIYLKNISTGVLSSSVFSEYTLDEHLSGQMEDKYGDEMILYVLSRNQYFTRDTIIDTGNLSSKTSSWDVFHKTNGNYWSGSFGIETGFLKEADGGTAFRYFGLTAISAEYNEYNFFACYDNYNDMRSKKNNYYVAELGKNNKRVFDFNMPYSSNYKAPDIVYFKGINTKPEMIDMLWATFMGDMPNTEIVRNSFNRLCGFEYVNTNCTRFYPNSSSPSFETQLKIYIFTKKQLNNEKALERDDNHPVIGNKNDGNILGTDGDWSDYYHLQGEVFLEKISNLNNNNKTYITFSETSARNRIRWVKSDKPVIVPISIFERFPFVVTERSNKEIILDYKKAGYGSTPMPAIETNPVKPAETGRIAVQYDLFDKTETLNFNIIFETRNSHCLYEGTSEKINIEGYTEIQGETDWNKLN